MFTWDIFIAIIKKYVDDDFPEEVERSLRFDSIGISSIKCIEILVEIEDMYNFEIPETYISERLFESLQSMYEIIKELVDQNE